MLLISPQEAALAIGAKCGGSLASEDSELQEILNLLTVAVEEALNVDTLTAGQFTERFEVGDMPPYNSYFRAASPKITFRLRNAFLACGTVEVEDPDGCVITEGYEPVTKVFVDEYYGTVSFRNWVRGTYLVTYQAGFEPEPEPDPKPEGYDPDKRVLRCIPDFVKPIVLNYLIQWYRTTRLQPRVTKDVSYASVHYAVRAAVYAAVYGKYQRPRTDCVWGERA